MKRINNLFFVLQLSLISNSSFAIFQQNSSSQFTQLVHVDVLSLWQSGRNGQLSSYS